jgi:hypothetical protein
MNQLGVCVLTSPPVLTRPLAMNGDAEGEEPSATQELPQSPATASALAKGSLEPVHPAVGVAAPLGPGWRTAKGKTGTPAKATASGSDPDHLLGIVICSIV